MAKYKFQYPVPRKGEYDIEKDYYANGVIPKAGLIDGMLYRGECRNADKAVWRADKNRWEYERTKFGETFTDFVEALEDGQGFDVFLPIEALNGIRGCGNCDYTDVDYAWLDGPCPECGEED